MKSDESLKSVDDLNIIDSESIESCILTALAELSLLPSNLIYIMADNCSTMQGHKSGVQARLANVAPRLIQSLVI